MASLREIQIRRAAIQEELEALAASELTAKADAIEAIKTHIIDNHLTYNDLAPILEILQGTQVAPKTLNKFVYLDVATGRGWSGVGPVPVWFKQNLDKAEEYLQERPRGKVHTPVVLKLLGKPVAAASGKKRGRRPKA